MQMGEGSTSSFTNLGSGTVTSDDLTIREITSDLEIASDDDFVTDRVIATSSSTNIVREGDTIQAKGTIDISNIGDVSATNFDFDVNNPDSSASFELTDTLAV